MSGAVSGMRVSQRLSSECSPQSRSDRSGFGGDFQQFFASPKGPILAGKQQAALNPGEILGAAEVGQTRFNREAANRGALPRADLQCQKTTRLQTISRL